MKRFLALSFLLTFLYIQPLHAQIIVPTFSDVNYANDSDIRHTMDIFIPPGLADASPCVMHVHGGGFNAGEKGQALPSLNYPSGTTLCDSLYYNGYVIADINYRLSSDSVFPAAVHDCKTAIRFLKSNASAYLIDTCRIGVIGESAGGYLVSMLGTSAGMSSLEGNYLGSTSVSSNVQSVMDLYGTTDFNYFDGYYPSVPPDSCSPYPCCLNDGVNNWIGKFLGCAISDCPSLVETSSALTYIDGDEPPFSIWHGTKDCTVPPIQSQLLYDSLIAASGDATLHYVLHGTHGDDSFFTDSFRQKVRTFFDSKLLISDPCFPDATSAGPSDPKPFSVKIFPDPATDVLNVLISSGSSVSLFIVVFNVLGNQILSSSLSSEKVSSFSINKFESGIYFYRIREFSGKERMNGKFIVQGK